MKDIGDSLAKRLKGILPDMAIKGIQTLLTFVEGQLRSSIQEMIRFGIGQTCRYFQGHSAVSISEQLANQSDAPISKEEGNEYFPFAFGAKEVNANERRRIGWASKQDEEILDAWKKKRDEAMDTKFAEKKAEETAFLLEVVPNAQKEWTGQDAQAYAEAVAKQELDKLVQTGARDRSFEIGRADRAGSKLTSAAEVTDTNPATAVELAMWKLAPSKGISRRYIDKVVSKGRIGEWIRKTNAELNEGGIVNPILRDGSLVRTWGKKVDEKIQQVYEAEAGAFNKLRFEKDDTTVSTDLFALSRG